jgi:hypothetical protein
LDARGGFLAAVFSSPISSTAGGEGFVCGGGTALESRLLSGLRLVGCAAGLLRRSLLYRELLEAL